MADIKQLKAAYQLAKMNHDSFQTEESKAAMEAALSVYEAAQSGSATATVGDLVATAPTKPVVPKTAPTKPAAPTKPVAPTKPAVPKVTEPKPTTPVVTAQGGASEEGGESANGGTDENAGQDPAALNDGSGEGQKKSE